MTRNLPRLTAALAALAAGVAGCGGGGSAAGAGEGGSRHPFTITSTLHGRTVVPHRIRWLAFPKLKGADVESVAFLIDGGRPRWVEKDPPYTFGDDENGEHKGYLVTSWLKPGEHRFTVRARASDGRKASDTVVARVAPAPEPPEDLGGVWRRKVPDTSGAPEPGSPGNPTDTLTPPGTYVMVIDRRWIQIRFPGRFRVPQSDETGEGWILDSDYSARASSLRVFGAVTFDTHHGQAELGWWCWPDGPPADYRWSTNGSTLTLTPKGTDPCAVRSFIWAGKWTRAQRP